MRETYSMDAIVTVEIGQRKTVYNLGRFAEEIVSYYKENAPEALSRIAVEDEVKNVLWNNIMLDMKSDGFMFAQVDGDQALNHPTRGSGEEQDDGAAKN